MDRQTLKRRDPVSRTPAIQKYTVKEGRIIAGTEFVRHPVQDNLPAHRRSFASEWQQCAEQTDSLAEASQKRVTGYYNRMAHNLPDLIVGSNVAIQHPRIKLWDTYGVVEHIGPHRQYHIRTKRGRVLIRNRCFICRRIPASIPLNDSTSAQSQIALPRRSERSRRPPNRLIENPNWI